MHMMKTILAVSLSAALMSAVQAADEQKSAANAPTADIPAVSASMLRADADPQKQKSAIETISSAVKNPEGITVKIGERRQPRSVVRVNESSRINAMPGENVFIPISLDHPNRILTPFKKPQVMSTTLSGGKGGDCSELCVRGGVIYVTTDRTEPVTMFVNEKGHEEVALSITMIPSKIPPKEVTFTLPESVLETIRSNSGDPEGMKKAEAWETSQPYVDTLREALRSVALGEMPQGYTMRTIRDNDTVPKCRHPGLDISFKGGQLLEGFNLLIYVGVITNKSDRPVEFREQACGSWDTAAVAAWPLQVMKPGQQTEIYIVRKRVEEQSPDQVRRPLIRREYN